jgi:hypothetical protein
MVSGGIVLERVNPVCRVVGSGGQMIKRIGTGGGVAAGQRYGRRKGQQDGGGGHKGHDAGLDGFDGIFHEGFSVFMFDTPTDEKYPTRALPERFVGRCESPSCAFSSI